MSVNTKMTAIANEIRTLSGTTVAMGLDAMAANIRNANSEIDSQADLLSQIVTALEGKAAPEGETNRVVETCKVNISNSNLINCVWYTTIDSNGKIVTINPDSSFLSVTQLTLTDVVCGTYVAVYCSGDTYEAINCEGLLQTSSNMFLFHITASKNETASITISKTNSNGGGWND